MLFICEWITLLELMCTLTRQALREDRTLSPKMDELKLQASFLHASPDDLLVGRIGNGTVGQGTAYSDSPDIYTTHLHAPERDVNFYFVRQRTNTKTNDTTFTLRVNTTLEGTISIPKSGSIVLAGRESKVVVTNYPFGSSILHYSTAEVMTWATLGGVCMHCHEPLEMLTNPLHRSILSYCTLLKGNMSRLPSWLLVNQRLRSWGQSPSLPRLPTVWSHSAVPPPVFQSPPSAISESSSPIRSRLLDFGRLDYRPAVRMEPVTTLQRQTFLLPSFTVPTLFVQLQNAERLWR